MPIPFHDNHASMLDVMSGLKPRSLPIITSQVTTDEAIQAMIETPHARILYVTDERGTLLGTISLGALIRHLFSANHEPQIHGRTSIAAIANEVVSDIMRPNPIYATEGEQIGDVLQRMISANVKEIPVVDSAKRVIADVTVLDLLSHLRQAPGE